MKPSNLGDAHILGPPFEAHMRHASSASAFAQHLRTSFLDVPCLAGLPNLVKQSRSATVYGCEVKSTALVPLPTTISVSLSIQTISAIEHFDSVAKVLGLMAELGDCWLETASAQAGRSAVGEAANTVMAD